MLCNLLGTGKWLSGYTQINPIRLQPRHSGVASEHLTLRRLQLKQPRRDLLKPLPGTGFFFLLRWGDPLTSVSDILSPPALGSVVESVLMEVCLEGIVKESTLPMSNAEDTTGASMVSEEFFKRAFLTFET